MSILSGRGIPHGTSKSMVPLLAEPGSIHVIEVSLNIFETHSINWNRLFFHSFHGIQKVKIDEFQKTVHSGEANLLSAAERVNHWRIIDHCLTVILETPSTDRTILDVKAPVDWCFTMFDVPPFLMIRAPCQSCFMDKFEPTIVTFHFFYSW